MSRGEPEPQSEGWGFEAFGRSRQFTIEVDSSFCGSFYEIAITNARFQIRWQNENLAALQKMAVFIRRNNGQEQFDEINLGVIGVSTVTLVKDDEFAGRFFLKIVGQPGHMCYTLINSDAAELLRAAEMALAELQ